jgi:DNA invertase Pin-like site-specific DNA recombinase
MTRFGYARASLISPDAEIQIEALKMAGCEVIRTENTSREQLETLLSSIGKGDSLVVTRIDRLARSVTELQNIVKELRKKGAYLVATEQPIDTTNSTGFIEWLGVFVDFDSALRKERQLQGIEAAKTKGVYKGRKPTIDPDEVKKLRKKKMGATEIANRLNISRASVYRLLRTERKKR